MAITGKNGRNSLVYVSAAQLIGGTAWSLAIEHAAVQYASHGDEWQTTMSGLKAWSGSLTAWHDHAATVLYTAAAYDGLVALLIYPDRTDITAYYSGNAVFGYGAEASMDAAAGRSADFTGTGTLAATGFA